MIHINTTLYSIVFLNKNDRNHRLNGPAFISENIKSWWLEGKRHRLDGPAYIEGNYKEWHINGIQYTENQFNKKLKEMRLK